RAHTTTRCAHEAQAGPDPARCVAQGTCLRRASHRTDGLHGLLPRDRRPGDRTVAFDRADAPAVRGYGPRLPSVASPDLERARRGTGNELAFGPGERGGEEEGHGNGR